MLTMWTGGPTSFLPFFSSVLLGSLAFISNPTPAGVPLGQSAISSGPPAVSRASASLAEASGGDVDPELIELRRELDEILREAGSPTSRWGILAVSLDRGDTLLALNPHGALIPASNMKLLTSAAALYFLGPEFRFRTFLLGQGQIEAGILHGDLLLYGTGDPTFSELFFPSEATALESLARDLIQKGIETIRGDLAVDGSYFRGPELHPEWNPSDLNEAFAAPVAALSVAENLITLRVVPGPWIGAPASIHTMPPGSGLQVHNTARTESPGTRSRIWLDRAEPSRPIGIEGEIPLRGREVWRELPVPDPLLFSGRQMERILAENGVRIQGGLRVIRDAGHSPISSTPPPGRGLGSLHRILAVHASPPLLDLLRVVNKQSNNLLAETVLKTMGRVVLGDGSFAGGAEAVERFTFDVVGVPPSSVTVRDGSGLSPQNRVSPGAIVQILEHLARSPEWEEFLRTLPEAGVRRELGRMSRTAAAGNLWAKTGTMDEVSALSGMARTRSGEQILFSVLSNGVASERRAKRAEDRIGIALSSLDRLPPQSPDQGSLPQR
jgi:D-alanyl-D-alanine carboxypeptidase/D-alanyl-D-alanine-endopeptidase (penicillin-binding protein 4)